jgi:catalase (peroxidase I)
MLPSDIALLSDPKLRGYIQLYADDQEAFFADFAKVVLTSLA